MTPVKGFGGEFLKLRCRLQVDLFMEMEIRHPPDATSLTNASAYQQHIHVMTEGNYKQYDVQHSY